MNGGSPTTLEGNKRIPATAADEEEIPKEVIQVLDEIENETDSDEESPDEEQMQVLEDIWLKAGEMGNYSPSFKLPFYPIYNVSLKHSRVPQIYQ